MRTIASLTNSSAVGTAMTPPSWPAPTTTFSACLTDPAAKRSLMRPRKKSQNLKPFSNQERYVIYEFMKETGSLHLSRNTVPKIEMTPLGLTYVFKYKSIPRNILIYRNWQHIRKMSLLLLDKRFCHLRWLGFCLHILIVDSGAVVIIFLWKSIGCFP